ncbi:CD276 antigen-like isoform X2 [Heptranchias perlo]|uniref:CD276 antigen-like isoform X2 n=1 Tax=Heptranchias perlo TaxID=212740 RepID=UPI003559E22B
MATSYFPKILCFIVFFFFNIAAEKFTSIQCESPVTGIHDQRTVLSCEYKSRNKKECNITWRYMPVHSTDWNNISCTSDNKRNAQKQRICHLGFEYASLIIEKTEISDEGKYQIFLDCQSSGYDLADVELLIKAPYTVPQITEKDQGGEKVLVCAALGYPLAHLRWQNENGTDLTANSTITHTEDNLYNITGYIPVVGEWCSVKYNCSVCIEITCKYARLSCSKNSEIYQQPKQRITAVVRVILPLGFIVLLALLALLYWKSRIPQAYVRARYKSTTTLIGDPE